MSTTIASLIRKASLYTLIIFSYANPAWGKVGSIRIIENKFDRTTEQTTVRLKVEDENQRPVDSLGYKDFQILVDGEPVKIRPQDFKNPQLATPLPTRIIVLLDMSGSMRHSISNAGVSKLQASVEAIRIMTEEASAKGGDIKIAVVPFGEGKGKCPQGDYRVNEATLNNFLDAGSDALNRQLNDLASQKPCAATNLYKPLERAIRSLSKSLESTNSQSQDSSKPQPRLAIILLTDGYHSEGKDQEYQKDLELFLTTSPNLTVFTLGYGLTAEELYAKYQQDCSLSKPVSRADFTACPNLKEEYVDSEVLQKIAKWGNGFHEFSGEPQDISENFIEFLDSILGEYQITYAEPNPERGVTHSLSAVVNTEDGIIKSDSPKKYLIDVFGRAPSRFNRYTSLLITLAALLIAGGIPFYFWQRKLKRS